VSTARVRSKISPPVSYVNAFISVLFCGSGGFEIHTQQHRQTKKAINKWKLVDGQTLHCVDMLRKRCPGPGELY